MRKTGYSTHLKNEFEVPDYTVDTIEELLNILKRGDTKLKFSVPF